MAKTKTKKTTTTPVLELRETVEQDPTEFQGNPKLVPTKKKRPKKKLNSMQVERKRAVAAMTRRFNNADKIRKLLEKARSIFLDLETYIPEDQSWDEVDTALENALKFFQYEDSE